MGCLPSFRRVRAFVLLSVLSYSSHKKIRPKSPMAIFSLGFTTCHRRPSQPPRRRGGAFRPAHGALCMHALWSGQTMPKMVGWLGLQRVGGGHPTGSVLFSTEPTLGLASYFIVYTRELVQCQGEWSWCTSSYFIVLRRLNIILRMPSRLFESAMLSRSLKVSKVVPWSGP